MKYIKSTPDITNLPEGKGANAGIDCIGLQAYTGISFLDLLDDNETILDLLWQLWWTFGSFAKFQLCFIW